MNDLKELTGPICQGFWSRFRPVSGKDLRTFELQLGRTLDPEFLEFYRMIGYGEFPNHMGGFYSPSEIMACLGAAIYFITGSLSPGQEWASQAAHTTLWLSRGLENPNSGRFTAEALTFKGVNLYDLLQFGSDGCGCYHQLYVGPEPAPLRYCLLTESQTMEDQSATFSEGLERIIAHQLLANEKFG